uniref:hypothetical protein n=1 Tax=Aliarcobacter sp. TaxID=2321116 RepID=UPI004048EA30
MINFSFEERLDWIYSDYYEFGNQVKVVEKNEAGKAEVLFKSSNDLLSICLSEENRLKYLKIANVADGTIYAFINESEIILHITECKRTINTKNWEKVKLQFKGGLTNSFGLCGILDKTVSKIIFYTAFREDSLDNKNTTNPILLKATLGTTKKTSAIDWSDKKINILNREFEHIKIQLDSDGKGRFSL